MTLAGSVRWGAALIATVAWLGLPGPALAQSPAPSKNASLAARVDALAAQVRQQEARLKAQERELAAARAALSQAQYQAQGQYQARATRTASASLSTCWFQSVSS
jgi:hypothetical protein